MASTTGDKGPLTDEGHIILKCSKCRTPLTDIWVTQKEMPLKSKIKAKCWRCDGESSAVEVNGGMSLGITDDSNIVDIEYLDSKYEGSIVTQQNVLVHTEQGG